jgi:hypothetical protein
MWERGGIAEVELLRRWRGRPVGTRVPAAFTLSLQKVTTAATGEAVGVYGLRIIMSVAEERPRETIIIPFAWEPGRRKSFGIAHRGEIVDFAGDIFDYALVRVRLSLETDDTRSGHQRFRVCRIDWQDPVPPARAGQSIQAADRPGG